MAFVGFIPPQTRCPWRVSDTEIVPAPRLDECVLFGIHLERGLSPPVHPFLVQLLWLYGIQLHHLTPDCILHISCFITFCEGYLDIHPHLGLWCSLFSLSGRVSGEGDPARPCGVVKVVPRSSQYPDLKLLGVSADWERSFFYFPEVPRSSGGPFLPPFNPDLPTSKECWNL